MFPASMVPCGYSVRLKIDTAANGFPPTIEGNDGFYLYLKKLGAGRFNFIRGKMMKIVEMKVNTVHDQCPFITMVAMKRTA